MCNGHPYLNSVLHKVLFTYVIQAVVRRLVR